MARDLGPKCRVCRREGMKLFLKGERCLTEKCAIERRSYPPGEHVLRMLETRLENVVYRLGFAASRAQARQLVRHGHFHVNGRRVNIPSYLVRPDDVVTMAPNSPAETVIRDSTDLTASVAPWLQADHDGLTGKILKYPEREEIDTPVQEQLIVELYSKKSGAYAAPP